MLFLCAILGFGTMAQSTITNGGFELWGNPTPGLSSEPTNWYSNQSGSTIATLGPQTCFKDIAVVHSGTAAVRVETLPSSVGPVVNGNVTTGVVDAPTITKTDGYIGTVNYTTSTDIRHMSFTARPDSLVGWYQYTQGGSAEQGKIRAILHTGDYFDPETPTTYHTNPTANKIADVTFLTPLSNVSSWTRFSVPFTYVSGSSPTYIMINITSSANQGTTVSGSKLWLDDLQVVYRPTGINNVAISEDNVKVYAYDKTVCVDFINCNAEQSVISIFDLTGKQVFSEKISSNQFSTFNLLNLNTGVYVYRLSNSSFCKKGKIFIQ